MENVLGVELNNSILIDNIRYWVSKGNNYAKALESQTFFIKSADLVTQVYNISEEVITNFIAGLVLIAYAKLDDDGNIVFPSELEKLVKPMIKIIIKHLKSEDFNKASINHYIKGDEKLNIEGLEIPITPEKIFDFWKTKTTPILNNQDANILNAKYVEFRRSFFNKDSDHVTIPYSEIDTIQKSETFFIVESHLDHIQDAFKVAKDYYIFVNILTKFFEYKEYNLPKQPINLVRNCKTRVAMVFNPLHKKLSNSDTLIGESKYFEIIRILNHFNELSDKEIYKSLTRY